MNIDNSMPVIISGYSAIMGVCEWILVVGFKEQLNFMIIYLSLFFMLMAIFMCLWDYTHGVYEDD